MAHNEAWYERQYDGHNRRPGGVTSGKRLRHRFARRVWRWIWRVRVRRREV